MSGTQNLSRPRFEPVTTRMWGTSAYGSHVWCGLVSASNKGYDWCYFNVTIFFLLYEHTRIYMVVGCNDISLLYNKTAISQPELWEALSWECNLFNISTLRSEISFQFIGICHEFSHLENRGMGVFCVSIARLEFRGLGFKCSQVSYLDSNSSVSSPGNTRT